MFGEPYYPFHRCFLFSILSASLCHLVPSQFPVTSNDMRHCNLNLLSNSILALLVSLQPTSAEIRDTSCDRRRRDMARHSRTVQHGKTCFVVHHQTLRCLRRVPTARRPNKVFTHAENGQCVVSRVDHVIASNPLLHCRIDSQVFVVCIHLSCSSPVNGDVRQ